MFVNPSLTFNLAGKPGPANATEQDAPLWRDLAFQLSSAIVSQDIAAHSDRQQIDDWLARVSSNELIAWFSQHPGLPRVVATIYGTMEELFNAFAADDAEDALNTHREVLPPAVRELFSKYDELGEEAVIDLIQYLSEPAFDGQLHEVRDRVKDVLSVLWALAADRPAEENEQRRAAFTQALTILDADLPTALEQMASTRTAAATRAAA